MCGPKGYALLLADASTPFLLNARLLYLSSFITRLTGGAALNSVLANQKATFADCKALSASLAKLYTDDADLPWPGTVSGLSQRGAAVAYRDAWENIHDSLRSTTMAVCVEQSLEPLRAAVTRLGPENDAMVKARATLIKDYDSYRRRLSGLKEKRDKAQAQGKDKQELNAEVQRFEAKVEGAGQTYQEANHKAKSDIISAKGTHDQLMESLLITTAVCQLELLSRASAELQQVVSLMPQDKVAVVRKRIDEYLKTGSVPTEARPGGAAKRPSILSGTAFSFGSSSAAASASAAASLSAAPSSGMAAAPSAPPTPASAVPPPPSTAAPKTPSASNPFGDEAQEKPQPPASPAPGSAMKGKPTVVALYDHTVRRSGHPATASPQCNVTAPSLYHALPARFMYLTMLTMLQMHFPPFLPPIPSSAPHHPLPITRYASPAAPRSRPTRTTSSTSSPETSWRCWRRATAAGGKEGVGAAKACSQ